MSDAREVLSALIDREPVDPEMLARVLEDPASRRLLVDFVRLRAAVTQDVEDEHAPRYSAPGSGLQAPGVASAASGSRRPAYGRSRGSRWLRVAAVFLLLTAGAGGGAWLERYASRDRPPNPDRIVRLEPIPAPPISRPAPTLDGRQ